MRGSETSVPTIWMSPDRSDPRVRGSGCGRTLLPALIQPSHGPTPAAWTLTRTSPGPGTGRGTRSNFIASGGPNSCTRQAIIGAGPSMQSLLLVRYGQGNVFGVDDEDGQ